MRKQVKPWAIYRKDGVNNLFLTRYKKRNDAEEYAKLLQANTPFKVEVIFDV